MSVTTVRLSEGVAHQLDALAGRTRRSKNWLVNQAVSEYLTRQQHEQQRWQETQVAMDSVANGRVVSEDVVHSWLASWGSQNELPAPTSNL